MTSLESLFKWLSQKDREKACWPHIIAQKGAISICTKCGKKMKSILKPKG